MSELWTVNHLLHYTIPHTRWLDYIWFYSLKELAHFCSEHFKHLVDFSSYLLYYSDLLPHWSTHITNIYLNNTTLSSTKMLYIQALHGQLLLCGRLLRWLLWDSYEEGTSGKRPTCSLVWGYCKSHLSFSCRCACVDLHSWTKVHLNYR